MKMKKISYQAALKKIMKQSKLCEKDIYIDEKDIKVLLKNTSKILFYKSKAKSVKKQKKAVQKIKNIKNIASIIVVFTIHQHYAINNIANAMDSLYKILDEDINICFSTYTDNTMKPNKARLMIFISTELKTKKYLPCNYYY